MATVAFERVYIWERPVRLYHWRPWPAWSCWWRADW